MATSTLAVTNTFAAATTADASQVNQNFTDIVDYINNRNDGTAEWAVVEVLATVAAAVVISGNQSTTEVSIDNTATTGDPQLVFKLSGTAQFSMGVDDSVTGDPLIIAASGALGTTNVLEVTGAAPHLKVISDDAATELAIDNTAATGDSTISFELSGTSQYTMGVDDSVAGDPFVIAASSALGTTNRAILLTTGAVAFGPNPSADTLFSVTTTAGEDIRALIFVNNAAGDPFVNFATNSTNWSIGLDNSDSDRFLICNSNAIGTTSVLEISATNFVPLGAATLSTGDASNYWNDISYKTLTDRGCLPFCDDGVELMDGRIVSDTEAIRAIEKHPTKLTVHGLPMLNYKSFPKKAFRKAESRGVVLTRDENDEPIGGADGIEMTMVFGVMLGAIKELTQRVEALEK